MKIATWNVNSLRIRMEHVLDWWDATQPDVLLLQETKVEDDKFPREPFAQRGLQLAIHGQKSYNGVAIVSRLPVTDVMHGFNGHIFNDHARVIAATVGGIRVASVYAPQGESTDSAKFAFKREFYQHIQQWVGGMAGQPLVAGGDFNIAADARDVDDPAKREGKCMFTPEERGWVEDLKKHNLHDAFRLVSDESGVFSWWDYRELAFQKNRGLRIDYLFVSDALKPRVAGVTHFREERKRTQPSDHVPVLLELRDA